MIEPEDERRIAARLIEAQDRATMLAPITNELPEFDVAAAYRVLARIEAQRIAHAWQPVGRKIGFTNTTIWERYGVHQPMWARVWSHTVQHAPGGSGAISLAGLVQPRLEPEVVFGIIAPVSSSDPRRALDSVGWIAAGFEVVQSHFPDWRFKAPDCTAAFGLHGALLVGAPRALSDRDRDALAADLTELEVTLRHGDRVVDRGRGENVLGGPAHALVHLARVLASQPGAPPLAPGELVTTGTITDAWPVEPGQSWSSEYRGCGLTGLGVTFR